MSLLFKILLGGAQEGRGSRPRLMAPRKPPGRGTLAHVIVLDGQRRLPLLARQAGDAMATEEEPKLIYPPFALLQKFGRGNSIDLQQHVRAGAHEDFQIRAIDLDNMKAFGPVAFILRRQERAFRVVMIGEAIPIIGNEGLRADGPEGAATTSDREDFVGCRVAPLIRDR